MNEQAEIAIIGGGPGGLSAAEVLATAGLRVTVYEQKPTVARKFLRAGIGGLNITHSENFDDFMNRYGAEAAWLRPALTAYTPDDLRAWCAGLGEETFVGSSGRVFPKSMKAAPLLRAWLRRLQSLGVQFKLGHEWQGWREDGALLFNEGTVVVKPRAALLALGGASWPKLGATGSWANLLAAKGVPLAPFQPANCGFIAAFSPLFAGKFAGTPLKPVTLTFGNKSLQGEIMITQSGIEGGAVYALSRALREAINQHSEAVLHLDLRPGLSREALAEKLSAPRGSASLSTFLRGSAGLSPVAIGLLREGAMPLPSAPQELAARIKACPLRLTATAGLERAISSAGGICHNAVDASFMLRALPGVFVAGEMLDWEAPTGGYLLQASISTARAAAAGLLKWVASRPQ